MNFKSLVLSFDNADMSRKEFFCAVYSKLFSYYPLMLDGPVWLSLLYPNYDVYLDTMHLICPASKGFSPGLLGALKELRDAFKESDYTVTLSVRAKSAVLKVTYGEVFDMCIRIDLTEDLLEGNSMSVPSRVEFTGLEKIQVIGVHIVDLISRYCVRILRSIRSGEVSGSVFRAYYDLSFILSSGFLVGMFPDRQAIYERCLCAMGWDNFRASVRRYASGSFVNKIEPIWFDFTLYSNTTAERLNLPDFVTVSVTINALICTFDDWVKRGLLMPF